MLASCSRVARGAGACLALLVVSSAQLAAQAATFTWDGPNDDDAWGGHVKLVGDLDADGVRDVAVGSPHAGYKVTSPFPFVFPDIGAVQVYSGDTGALLHSWRGNLSGGDEYGFAIADAGDNDGDGHDDVLIGAPNANHPTIPSTRTGVVELRSGADGSLLRRWNTATPGARFGHALAAGDMDGDGIFDVAVGQPHRDLDALPSPGPGQEGHVNVYRGSDASLMLAIPGDHYELGTSVKYYERVEWGASLAFVGDTDGDGFGEILASAPHGSFHYISVGQHIEDCGFVLHFAPALGPLGEILAGNEGDQIGAAVDLLGDANNNGDVEFLVGAPGVGAWGAVRVYENQLVRLEFPGTATRPLGDVLAGIGDASGNGLPDILLGSPLADPGSPLMKLDAGVVEVRLGLTGTLLRRFEGGNGGDRLGASVDAGVLATEVRDQLLLGAPFADAGGDDRGRVQLFPSGLCDAPASWENFGPGLAGTLGEPSMISFGAPTLGESYTLVIGNSAGTPTLAYLLVGLAPLALPAKGGTVLVDALLIQGFPLAVGSNFLDFALPEDAGLCGLDVFGQTLQLDPGAALGVSFTKGMRMTLGH